MAKGKAAKPVKKAVKAAKKAVKKAVKAVKKPVKAVKKPAPKKAPAKAVKKAVPAKKAVPVKKAPARKAAPVKPVKKAAAKAAPQKAAKAPAKAPVKKAAPAKAPAKAPAPAKAAAGSKAAPAKAAAPVKAPAKAPAPAKAAPPAKAAAAEKAEKAPKPVKQAAARKAAAPEIVAPVETEAPFDLELPPEDLGDDVPLDIDVEDIAAVAAPVVGPTKGKPGRPPKTPGKRGRPPKKARSLAEMLGRKPKKEKVPKRLRRRRRLNEDDMDLPVTPRAPAPRDTMSMDEIRADVTARYLAGETPMCPVGCGGMAQVVRISSLPSGAGDLWLECLSCAQRERFEIPAPTAQERQNAFEQLEAGNEPICPRHGGRWVQLRRRGRDFACPECGILIAGRDA